MKLSTILASLAIAAVSSVHAGPLTDGVCQTGCKAAAAGCYSAAGMVFGAVTAGIATPVVALACNAVLDRCQAECAIQGADAVMQHCVDIDGVDGDTFSNIKYKLCEIDGGQKPLFGVFKEAAGDLVTEFDGPGRYAAALKSLKGDSGANQEAVDVARPAYAEAGARVG
ncbi:uncharacterized protein TRAVEDRAFT_66328 [Trametes versicolor FP-101664 SS1]|uniref:uncharacterized protein n=1 Tax=Trametes versicolor (strain FP-101664) TaxID=717944 RepID=UPI00046234D2|nr:uncharacterized protein TRAVEDRAFT_66328 [Trametes versicolor FP-101664 SS1]EIW54775.1 hypothetical protein TRAVEDRAFT_66328 [Trametes versicolor FP-101664 SS1]